MIKKLVKHGNSHALVIDRTMMESLGITEESRLNVTVRDGAVIIVPAESDVSAAAFDEAKDHVMKQYDAMLRRLAQ